MEKQSKTKTSAVMSMRIASSHLHGKRGEKSEQNVATTPVKGTAISIDDFALQRVEEQENKPNGMRPTTSGTKEVDRERGGGKRGTKRKQEAGNKYWERRQLRQGNARAVQRKAAGEKRLARAWHACASEQTSSGNSLAIW